MVTPFLVLKRETIQSLHVSYGWMSKNTKPKNEMFLLERDEKIRRVDENRWLSSRYAHREGRERLMVVYAFEHELQRALTMSEGILGRVRIQWWREVIAQIETKAPPRRHELTDDLESLCVDAPVILNHFKLVLDLYDAHLDAKLAGQNLKAALIEAGGLIGMSAGHVLDGSTDEFADALRRCGELWATYCEDGILSAEQFDPAKEAFSRLPPVLAPAMAHLAFIRPSRSEPMSSLLKRWRIFRTIMTGRL